MTLTTLRPYAAYKPSGVLWLGDVPSHWEVRRLRSIATIVNGATPSTGVPAYWDGDILWITPEDLGQLEGRHIADSARRITHEGYEASGTTLVPSESIAISTRAPIGHIGILEHTACVNQGCRLLVPNGSVNSDYLYYELITTRSELESLGQGSTFAELSRGKLGGFSLVIPPLPEQAAIVRYLDHADRRIRRYVGAKRKLIALLEEERQTVISRAVTRGLDPNVRLKPSGVKWLGDVPEHWAILPLKRWVSTKITDGPHETPALLDNGIPFMSAESMVGGRLDFSRRRGFISREQHEVYCRKCRPQRDDIFMCKSGATTGKVAIVETSDEFSVWSPLALIRVDPQRVLTHLLFAALQARYVQRQIQDTWSYGTQPNLSMGAMERLLIVLPPIEEQREVLAHLNRATWSLAEAVDRAHRAITLLQEYRTRLIADVVTGKLDVREAAAQLPGESDDEEPFDEDELTEDVDGSHYDSEMAEAELTA